MALGSTGIQYLRTRFFFPVDFSGERPKSLFVGEGGREGGERLGKKSSVRRVCPARSLACRRLLCPALLAAASVASDDVTAVSG